MVTLPATVTESRRTSPSIVQLTRLISLFVFIAAARSAAAIVSPSFLNSYSDIRSPPTAERADGVLTQASYNSCLKGSRPANETKSPGCWLVGSPFERWQRGLVE